MKRYTLFGFCCLAMLFAAANMYGQGFTGSAAPQIDGERAIQIAFTRIPAGATLIEIEWELKRGWSELEIKAFQNGMRYEIKIDGGTGQITSFRERQYAPRTPLPQPPQNRISFERVREIVQSMHPAGIIEEIQWEFEYGRWVYEAAVRVNGRKTTIYLDSITGTQLQRTRSGKNSPHTSQRKPERQADGRRW